MLTIAYLANQFPCELEPYVGDEIAELRRRGAVVITGSVRSPNGAAEMPDIVLQHAAVRVLGPAMWLLISKWNCVLPLLIRIVSSREPVGKRMKALLHTILGACYAALLRDHDGPDPCASRIFRVMDRHDRGTPAERRIQHDAARLGSAAECKLSRSQTRAMRFLRHHL